MFFAKNGHFWPFWAKNPIFWGFWAFFGPPPGTPPDPPGTPPGRADFEQPYRGKTEGLAFPGFLAFPAFPPREFFGLPTTGKATAFPPRAPTPGF